MSARRNSSPPLYSVSIPFRTARSPSGRTSSRPSAASRYIRAVHSPTPYISVSSETISSSERPASPSRVRSRSRKAAAIARRYSVFVRLTPTARSAAGSTSSTRSGVTSPSRTSNARSRIAVADAVESCWLSTDTQSRRNSSSTGSTDSRPWRSISRAIVGSSRSVETTSSSIDRRSVPDGHGRFGGRDSAIGARRSAFGDPGPRPRRGKR